MQFTITPVILLFLLLSLPVAEMTAQKYSNEFMTLGIGAREKALGNSIVASVEGTYAAYWNPAGLVRSPFHLGAGVMHTEWFAGIGKFDYGGVHYIPEEGDQALGVYFLRFGIDNIPNTLGLIGPDGTVNYDNITYFTAADHALVLNYARQLGAEGLSIGGNAKIIYRNIGSLARAWGFGLDAGVQYHRNQWRWGAVAYDVTGTFNAWSFFLSPDEEEVLRETGNELPENSIEVTRPRVALGMAYLWEWGMFSLLPEGNLTIYTDGTRNMPLSGNTFSIDPVVGIEAGYRQMIFLRVGINNGQTFRDFDRDYYVVQPNAGVGVRIGNFSIDYALTDIGQFERRSYSHVISLQAGFRPRNAQ